MADRKIQYVITIDDSEARAKVRSFDQSVAGAGESTTRTTKAVSEYDKQTQTLVKSKQAATMAVDKYSGTTATASASTATLAGQVAAATGVFGAQAPILSTVAVAVEGVAVAQGAATVATTGWMAATVGFISTVAGVVMAMAPYLVVLAVAIQLLKDWIEASGKAALAQETASAKQDVINKAIAEGAPKTISYGDAVKYVNEQHRHTQAMIPEVAYNRYVKTLADHAKTAMHAAAEQEVLNDELARHGIVVGEDTDFQKTWTAAVETGKAAAEKARAEHEKLRTQIAGIERKGYDSAEAMTIMAGSLTTVGTKTDDIAQLKKEFDSVTESVKRADAAVHQLNVTTAASLIGGGTLPSREVSTSPFGLPGVSSDMPGNRMTNTVGDAITRSMADLPQIMMAAFTGGGGVSGVVNAMGTKIGLDLLGPGGALAGAAKAATGGLTSLFGKTIGGALGAAIPGIGALIGPGLQLLWGGIKKLFGGPSKEELAGRDLVSGFEQQIAGMLTAGQRLEAGGLSWKATAIGIRDAYVKVGLSEQQAMADAERLWASSKGGADAAAAAIATIQANLDKATAATKDQAAAAVVAGQAQEQRAAEMQKSLDGLMSKRDALWSQIAGEAPEEVMGVIEAGQRAQLAVLDEQIAQQRVQMDEEARLAAAALQGALESIQPQPVHVPVVWDIPTLPSGVVEAPAYAAHGGLVTASGIQYLAGGGTVLPFVARGSDTVRAMLTPGEGVVSRRGMDRLGRDGLAALNHGRGGGASFVFGDIHVEGGAVGMSETEFGQKVSSAAIATMKRRGIRFEAA